MEYSHQYSDIIDPGQFRNCVIPESNCQIEPGEYLELTLLNFSDWISDNEMLQDRYGSGLPTIWISLTKIFFLSSSSNNYDYFYSANTWRHHLKNQSSIRYSLVVT